MQKLTGILAEKSPISIHEKQLVFLFFDAQKTCTGSQVCFSKRGGFWSKSVSRSCNKNACCSQCANLDFHTACGSKSETFEKKAEIVAAPSFFSICLQKLSHPVFLLQLFTQNGQHFSWKCPDVPPIFLQNSVVTLRFRTVPYSPFSVQYTPFIGIIFVVNYRQMFH